MLTYTKHTLGKLEDLLREQDFAVRYEKGSFQSGYCLVENRKVAVVNKFFDVEARINTLLEIIDQLEIDEDCLSERSVKLLRTIEKSASGTLE